MNYFEVLGLEKEPFSTSPDPDFFYLSKGHERALTNSLIELQLRRGLTVILGDVGMGKTTLSRKLIQELKQRENFHFHMIFDPSFETEHLLLDYLVRNFNCAPTKPKEEVTTIELKEALESFLFQMGVNENKIIVLIIDEAQKLNQTSLEVLRVLLNYETNQFKLLQLILLGQMEFYPAIMKIPNLLDRISFKYTLNPFAYDETREMIRFRIRQAGYSGKDGLFSDEAVRKIYQLSKGYPRRIIMFCHQVLKKLILEGKAIADEKIVNKIIQEERTEWQMKEPLPKKGY